MLYFFRCKVFVIIIHFNIYIKIKADVAFGSIRYHISFCTSDKIKSKSKIVSNLILNKLNQFNNIFLDWHGLFFRYVLIVIHNYPPFYPSHPFGFYFQIITVYTNYKSKSSII